MQGKGDEHGDHRSANEEHEEYLPFATTIIEAMRMAFPVVVIPSVWSGVPGVHKSEVTRMAASNHGSISLEIGKCPQAFALRTGRRRSENALNTSL